MGEQMKKLENSHKEGLENGANATQKSFKEGPGIKIKILKWGLTLALGMR